MWSSDFIEAKSNSTPAIHDGKKYPGQECEFPEVSRSYLTSHKQAIHEATTKKTCREYDHQLTTGGHLPTHQQAVNEGLNIPMFGILLPDKMENSSFST